MASLQSTVSDMLANPTSQLSLATIGGVIFLLASYPTSILIRRLEKSLAY